ncbi:MAG: DUF1289 domain-containing protein [Rhodocyclaceae bacterium]|nr:DUF1289 domain-containing protein [Rhodocyclaceae bacterium]
MTPSPCIQICRIDPGTGWCEGCYRTIAEITAWSAAPEAQRQAILARVAERSGSDTLALGRTRRCGEASPRG